MTSFEIDGSEFTKLADQLERAGEAVSFLIRGAVKKTTLDIAKDAKNFVPVDTGNLKNSIHTSLAGSNANVAQGTVQAQANYSKYVEFGTSRTAPQAYMGPAADRNEPALRQALGQIAETLGGAL